MVPGSIADFLQASVLLGVLAGLGGILWASIGAETIEAKPKPRLGPPATEWSAKPDQMPLAGFRSPQRRPTRSLAQRRARDTRVRTGLR